jgi:hypothetical protein
MEYPGNYRGIPSDLGLQNNSVPADAVLLCILCVLLTVYDLLCVFLLFTCAHRR